MISQFCRKIVQIDFRNTLEVFLILNFHRVLNIVCILLGISPASYYNIQDPMRMWQGLYWTEWSIHPSTY